MASKVKTLSVAELEAMHTGSLMSRRKALLKCEESSPAGRVSHGAQAEFIEYKDTPAWQRAYRELKAVLATREHVPNKQERKAMRQARAQNTKGKNTKGKSGKDKPRGRGR